jgi:5-methylcytosine-specific restriction endonuclease McrA
MVNLRYPRLNEHDEFANIVTAKKEPRKAELQNISPQVYAAFDNYLNNFNTIASLGISAFTGSNKENLKHCYLSSTESLSELKVDILNSQTREFKHLCPYCLIDPHSTFDHYLPIEEYSEFSVLAKNLIPCCFKCNDHKLNYWRDAGVRKIIHFFNDNIPTTKFLHANVTMNANIPIIKFSIQHVPGINTQTYNLINSHFTRLHLIKRYNDLVDKEVSNIKIIIDGVKKGLTPIAITSIGIKNILIQIASNNRSVYGNNYWRAILWEEIANNVPFVSSL